MIKGKIKDILPLLMTNRVIIKSTYRDTIDLEAEITAFKIVIKRAKAFEKLIGVVGVNKVFPNNLDIKSGVDEL